MNDREMSDRERNDRAQYETLARGIFAAWTADRLNNRSIDNVLKRYAPPEGDPIGSFWIEIAKKVDEYARAETDVFKWLNRRTPPTPPDNLSE
jgi:hypothetical protein